MGAMRVSKNIVWSDGGQDAVDDGLRHYYRFNWERPPNEKEIIKIYNKAVKNRELFIEFWEGFERDYEGKKPSLNEYKHHLKIGLGIGKSPLLSAMKFAGPKHKGLLNI